MKSEQEWERELRDILEELRNNSIWDREIYLDNRQLDANGAKVLASALKKNHSLTAMHLYSNDIGAEGATTLAEALKENPSLTTMDLSWNNIRAKGASALAEALKVNHSLITMHLNYNRIGAEGASALAEALKVNHSLRRMNLNYNRIGAKGASALAEALKVNHSLTTMDLYENCLGEKGVAALAEALKENPSLTTMDLGLNSIWAKDAAALAEALKENYSLTEMNLNMNDIGAEGAAALAEALKVNRSLTTMNLYENNIGAKGAAALAEALKENHSLTTMNLNRNNIGAEQEKIIKKYLDHNIALRDQLHQAIQAADLKKTEEYIQDGVGLLSVTGEGENTPLHWAAAKGHIDIVKLLVVKMIEQKLNLAMKNKDGKTPLDLAKDYEYEEVITFLKETMLKLEKIRKIVIPIISRLKDVNNISQVGNECFVNEEFNQALDYYESVLYLQPQNVPALVRKGLVLQKLDQLEAAKQVYRQAIAIEDKDAEKYHQQAKRQLEQIEKEQALLQQAMPTIVSTSIDSTEREELLGQVSSKAELRKSTIQPNSATKQTPLSQNQARIQFNAKTTLQINLSKQNKNDPKENHQTLLKRRLLLKY